MAATDAEALQLINTYGLPSIGRYVVLTPADINVWRQQIDTYGYAQAAILIRNAANSIKDQFPLLPVTTPPVTSGPVPPVVIAPVTSQSGGVLNGKIFGIDTKFILIAVAAYFVLGKD